MKGTVAAFSIIALLAIIFLPTFFTSNVVSAQNSSYSIQSVGHNIEVLFSGHIVIRDEIKVSGSLANGFLIGIPSTFNGAVLEVVAYDENQAYQVDTDVSLGGQSGFYGAKVNFNGANPSSFTVVFVLSNSLMDQQSGYYKLDYPAYPSFTVAASSCSVTLSLPAEPYLITISKSDGDVNATSYSKTNLAAYTNNPGKALFNIEYGLLQLNTINNINRQITIDPAGTITCSDSYNIVNIDDYRMFSFLFNLPSKAANVVVKDGTGKILESSSLGNVGSIIIVNATLSAYLSSGQSQTLTATYNMPNSGNTIDFELFPAINYYANQGVVRITFPEGAQITSPQSEDLDSSTTITKDGYQETLTKIRQGVSYVDYTIPNYNTIHLSYNYNPVWSSFRPTIWVFGIAAVACIGIVIWKKQTQISKLPRNKKKKVTAETHTIHTGAKTSKSPSHSKKEMAHKFLEEYDERFEISNEMDLLDQKAQKGKIPRSQYRIQRKTLENHYATLTKNINEAKEVFRKIGGELSDIISELELAEANFNKAANRVKNYEAGLRSGEISIEKYKENIDEVKENKDDAEAEINGILLRIREKIH